MTTWDCALPWWQTGVIYQIYPRSFQDTNADGVGDLQGVIYRLDYLQQLGIDAIWLSPFYPSPMKDYGYDVSDYTDVHPLFGDLPTFDRLVAEAHARDIRVVIDYVPNHSSDQHQWFVESRSSRTNSKRDWYYWRDARRDGNPPNNWLSLFGGSAWEWDEATGQYYLHSFLKEQPDLNWRNPEVKQAMFDVARFWLDRGVDGFRIDVAAAIMKDPDMRDNPPKSDRTSSRFGAEWDRFDHIHSYAHPDIHGVYKEFRQLLDSYDPPRLDIGEVDYEDLDRWVGYYGEALDEMHLPFGFHLLHTHWSAENIRRIVDTVEDRLPEGAWPNWVLGNHDEPRIASRIGIEQSRVAMMLLLTLRGTPTIYYGDELGMHDVYVPPELAQDPLEATRPGAGRDPERTPMQWDPVPNAGFCGEGITPWLPLADDYPEVNVEAESGDPRSMLSMTRELLRLRRVEPALTIGSYRSVDAPEGCYGYVREHGTSSLLILLNFCGEPRQVPLSEPWEILLSTEMDAYAIPMSDVIRLRPNEGCVLRSRPTR